MTAFGNFAPFDTGSAEHQSGKVPADIGLGDKGNSWLVQHAQDMSPATNFIKQSGTSDLPAAGYGSGPLARLNDTILRNLGNSQLLTGPMPLETATTARPLASDSVKTLRSILPAVGFGRAADATTSNRPADLIDALSGSQNSNERASLPRTSLEKTNLEARATAPLPPGPFTTTAQAARADLTMPTDLRPVATAQTGPLPTVARVETAPANAAAFDVKSHPLFANINKDAKTFAPYNFNARMDGTASIDALSRQIMPLDFNTRSWPSAGDTRAKAANPFSAANCEQSMTFHPDGTVTTTTTLPDGSASKIEAAYPDKSKFVALTDSLGRSTVEQRTDKNGQLVSHTTRRFDNASAPMVASQETVQTGTQTIEKRMNETGTVIASKIMPYSDLNDKKSIA